MNTKVFIQLLICASVFALFTMPQAMGEQECYADKVIFKQKCQLSIARDIMYIHPTDSCCRAAQKVDMPCVCRIITPDEEHKINPRYVFYVSQDCNNPVPAGAKCGSECPWLFSFTNSFTFSCFLKLDCSTTTTTITTPPHAAVKANPRDFRQGKQINE
ncbi:hypothetical protein EJB05_15155, partial [Eragrostis curvula]